VPFSFAPFGLRAVAAFGSHGNEVRQYAAPNGAACPNLAKGSPVKLEGGVIVSAGGGTGPLLGSVVGVAFIDGVSRQPVVDQYLPADVSSAGFIDGDNRPQVYVADNPEGIYMIQADASVSAGDVGLNFNVTATAADQIDTVMKISRHALDASTRTSAITGAVKLVGLARVPDNAWSDPFPLVLVRLNSQIAMVSAG
jgi:hypothetical protein